VSDSGGSRTFLSIGEVLELLKEEFPDITISKIRFLESQGLIDPERTPSGYRKFYEPDVARLRWILQQQREHFLPLKVIKEKLAARADAGLPVPPSGPPPQTATTAPTAEPAELAAADQGGGEDAVRAIDQQPEPRRRSAPASPLLAGLSAVSMTLSELCSATGLDERAVRELEQYGLVAGRPVAGQVYYDEEALVVARLAADMARHGVGARHLRMYKTAAEREAGFYEQVVLPLMKQRNPVARRHAVETLESLTRLGEGLRAAFLRGALRDYTDG
jgi:DNA-binding transcriptional MerR regulator